MFRLARLATHEKVVQIILTASVFRTIGIRALEYGLLDFGSISQVLAGIVSRAVDDSRECVR